MTFKIIALLLIASLYTCYYIKVFLQKRQGIKTVQLGLGKKGLVKCVETAMTAASVIVLAAELLSVALDKTLLPVWARCTGAVVASSGVALFICTVKTMGNSWRAGVASSDKTKLVTNGIFKISRNPAFSGFDLFYLGLLLMFFNYALLAATALVIITLHLQIVKAEEPFLIEAFGSEYNDYMKTVKRYFGRSLKR